MDDGALKRLDDAEEADFPELEGDAQPPEMSEEEWASLMAEHDALQPSPGEMRRFEERLGKLNARERRTAEVQAFARLRPDDRALIEKLTGYWAKVLKATKPREIDPLARAVWEGGKRRFAERQKLRRFASQAVEPNRVVELNPDHGALATGLSIFPSTVKSPWDSPRLLVSGHNNSKLGGKIEKGDWKGMPLFHLTLEERASCPRSCPLWAGCYGNAMHMARRHEHLHPDFLDLLRAEVWMLAREHKDTGFAIRLHTLGDFFSVEYVLFWAELCERLPQLHVFGYSQNHHDAADPGERAIGEVLSKVAEGAWDQFAIRRSNTRGPRGAIVIDDPSEAGDAIMCPAQHTAAEADGKSEACSTCGLCWSAGAKDKTIAFLRHGMKARGPVDAETEAA